MKNTYSYSSTSEDVRHWDERLEGWYDNLNFSARLLLAFGVVLMFGVVYLIGSVLERILF